MFAGHTDPPAPTQNQRAIHSDTTEPFSMAVIQHILLFNICCWYFGFMSALGLRCGMSSQGHCQVVTAALFSNGIRSTNESVKFSSEMSCRCARLRRCLPNGRAGGPRICHAHYTAMVKPLIRTCREIEKRLDLLYLPALDDPLFFSHPSLFVSFHFFPSIHLGQTSCPLLTSLRRRDLK